MGGGGGILTVAQGLETGGGSYDRFQGKPDGNETVPFGFNGENISVISKRTSKETATAGRGVGGALFGQMVREQVVRLE